jgi:hypothetical protein
MHFRPSSWRSLRSLLTGPFIAISLLALPAASSAADLSGSWSGYWESDSTGHRGPLRCTLTKVDQDSYRADFSGRFFKIIPFRYSLELDVVQEEGDTVNLAGQHRLGRRLGDFYYDAEATSQDFVATYSSCKDDGRFVLSRCSVCPAEAK